MSESTPSSDPTLWAKIRAGDGEARAWLIEQNYGLVKRLALKQARRLPAHVDSDEIISFGALGLLRAVENYDPSSNVYFETYAAASIRSLILDELRSLDWAPRSLRRKQRAIDEVTEVLTNEEGRSPTDREVAERLGLRHQDVTTTRQSTVASYHKSLDEGDPDRDWGAEDGDPSTESRAISGETVTAMDRITEAIRDMPVLAQVILALRYFSEHPDANGELISPKLREVALELGITESRASQIHSRAVVQVRDAMRTALKDVG